MTGTGRKIGIAATLFAVGEIATWIVARIYGDWFLGQPLGLQSFCRWDCDWYATIVANGYDRVPSEAFGAGEANWAFFPLFPLLAWPLHGLVGLAPQHALLLAGSLLMPVCIYLFITLVEAHEIAIDPWVAGSLVAFNPCALYAHAGYSEPLYFTLAIGALLALRDDRWLWAGLLGGACSATRLVGVFLVLPMAARLLGGGDRAAPPTAPRRWLKPLLAMALVPVGVIMFSWLLYERSGDFLAFIHIQVAWQRTLQSPLLVWWHAIREPGWPRVHALTASLGLLASIYLCARGMVGYGLLLAATILLPLTSAVYSMPRFLFWQPVFLLALAELAQRRVVAYILLPLLGAGSLLLTAAWFSGESFVT